MRALYGREYDGLSGPTAAQLTVLSGLHDRVGFAFKRLREIEKPLESLTAVSAGSVVLNHNAGDLIKPSATVCAD